jgi:transglutaminase-like putative cysteine protease
MTDPAASHIAGRWFAVALLLGAVGTAAAQPTPPAYEETWFTLEMQGQKCGYLHSTTKTVGDQVHTRSYMQIEIARGVTKLKVSSDDNFRETTTGRPLAFKRSVSMGSAPMSYSGTIDNGRLTLITEQFGVQREATYDFDPEIRFAWGQLLEQRKRGLKPGTTYTLKTYEPSAKVDGPITVEFEVLDKEEVDVLGEKRKLTRVSMTLLMSSPIKMLSWVDDDFSQVVATFNMGVFQFKMLAATKEQALGGAEPPELFISTFVHVKRKISRDARRVKLRLKLPPGGDDRLPRLPQTSMQTVNRLGDHEAVVTISRLDWKGIRAAGPTSRPSDDATEDYLRASTMCDIEDVRVKHLAKKAVKGCKTPAEKADALRKFVTDYVNDKSLDVGFATASEVARNRQGDCTEHAVLLAALARAAGLPARGVSGIVQIPGGSSPSAGPGAFGYHMWTQVYISDQWVDIDAALRQTDCDPTHIALAIMPLNDEGMLDSIMSLLPLLGRLQIEVIEVEQ